jgi:hypothetical protein
MIFFEKVLGFCLLATAVASLSQREDYLKKRQLRIEKPDYLKNCKLHEVILFISNVHRFHIFCC